MTYNDIVKYTFKKFYAPTFAATMGIAVMSILIINFASIFFGKNGFFTVALTTSYCFIRRIR